MERCLTAGCMGHSLQRALNVGPRREIAVMVDMTTFALSIQVTF
jgi:hypothetical protein